MPDPVAKRAEPHAPAPRIWPAVLVVWALVAAYMLARDYSGVLRGFGDTDDATRMVMVRDLLHGRGWWDQTIWRLQPPSGVVMHWSRLLDAALATLDGGLSAPLGAARGELAMRLAWPLLLIGPAVAAILAITRRLASDGERAEPAVSAAAVIAAAAACVVGLPLYAQFHPGRIDHHNVQILLWLAAWAGAAAARPRLGGATAGLAIGLGLAVGLEALVFDAAIAAFLASRFVMDEAGRPRLRAFAAALLATTTLAFLVQTPPARWGLSACDALALNLTAGIALGALGLLGASCLGARFLGRSRLARLGGVAAAGATAGAAYLGLDPHCLHGPFADVDPAIRPIWLAGVQEMAPLWVLVKTDVPSAIALIAAAVMALLAWAATGLAERRASGRCPGAGYWLGGLMLALAVPQAFAMLRAGSYLGWAATPPLALAAARVARWLAREGRIDRVRVATLALVLSPTVEASLALSVLRFAPPAAAAAKPAKPVAPDHCFDQASYTTLAALPRGRVLAEPDLGPFVLAYTPDAAIAAPYHRMARGLLAGHAAFSAPASGAGPADARRRTAALGARYVLACPAHAGRLHAPPRSLRAALEAGRTPAWLEQVSAPQAALSIYRVRP